MVSLVGKIKGGFSNLKGDDCAANGMSGHALIM